MRRLAFALIAVLSFVVCACQRHPLPGQTVIEHTHASGGAPAAHEEEAAPAPHAAPAAGEEKPTFFPEKK